jgi:hypothetical protein
MNQGESVQVVEIATTAQVNVNAMPDFTEQHAVSKLFCFEVSCILKPRHF